MNLKKLFELLEIKRKNTAKLLKIETEHKIEIYNNIINQQFEKMLKSKEFIG